MQTRATARPSALKVTAGRLRARAGFDIPRTSYDSAGSPLTGRRSREASLGAHASERQGLVLRAQGPAVMGSGREIPAKGSPRTTPDASCLDLADNLK